MSSTPNKLAELLRPLQAATERGQVAWRNSEDDLFRAALENALIECQAGYDPQRDSAYVAIRLIDHFGRVVASEVALADDERYEQFRELFELARRHALGFDEIAENLKKELHGLLGEST